MGYENLYSKSHLEYEVRQPCFGAMPVIWEPLFKASEIWNKWLPSSRDIDHFSDLFILYYAVALLAVKIDRQKG